MQLTLLGMEFKSPSKNLFFFFSPGLGLGKMGVVWVESSFTALLFWGKPTLFSGIWFWGHFYCTCRFICRTYLFSRHIKLVEYLFHCPDLKVEEETEALKLFGRDVAAPVFVHQLKHRLRVTHNEVLLLLVLCTESVCNRPSVSGGGQ